MRAKGVAPAGTVLPRVPPADEDGEKPVDGADMQAHAVGKLREADFSSGGGEGFQDVERAVQRLHPAALSRIGAGWRLLHIHMLARHSNLLSRGIQATVFTIRKGDAHSKIYPRPLPLSSQP